MRPNHFYDYDDAMSIEMEKRLRDELVAHLNDTASEFSKSKRPRGICQRLPKNIGTR